MQLKPNPVIGPRSMAEGDALADAVSSGLRILMWHAGLVAKDTPDEAVLEVGLTSVAMAMGLDPPPADHPSARWWNAVVDATDVAVGEAVFHFWSWRSLAILGQVGSIERYMDAMQRVAERGMEHFDEAGMTPTPWECILCGRQYGDDYQPNECADCRVLLIRSRAAPVGSSEAEELREHAGVGVCVCAHGRDEHVGSGPGSCRHRYQRPGESCGCVGYTEKPRCDFCSEPDAPWAYPTKAVSHQTTVVVELGGGELRHLSGPINVSHPGWAACEKCAELIEAGDPKPLAARALLTLAPDQQLDLDQRRLLVRQQEDVQRKAFWDARTGERVPASAWEWS